MSKYRYLYSGGEGVQCDSCSCIVPVGDFDWGPPFGNDERYKRPRRLCEFCASSGTDAATREMPRTDFQMLRAEIWKAAAAAANYGRFGAIHKAEESEGPQGVGS